VDHGHLVFIEGRVRGEDLVDDMAWEADDVAVSAAGGALQQFGLGGQQIDGGVATLRLIDRADDSAGGVADAQQLAGGAGGRCEDRDDPVVAQQPIDEDVDACGGELGGRAVDRGAAGEVDDGVAPGEARRAFGDAVRSGERVEQPWARLDGWCVLVAAALQSRGQRRLEDVAGVVAGGERFTDEPVVQRPAVADLDLPLAGGQRGSLRGVARRGVEVETTGDQGSGDLAAPLGPLATQPGWNASDLPLLVTALPSDAEPTGQLGAQRGLIDAVGGFGVLEQQSAVERRPAAV
jgi:hypothetical protein